MKELTLKRIKIPFFPNGLKLTTPVFIGLAIYLAFIGYPIWLLPLVMLSAVILKTEYVTEIDFQRKVYRDYISVVTIPFDVDEGRFDRAERIVISKLNHSQVLNTRAQSRQLDWSSFTATLVMDHTKTLELLSRTDKRELLEELKPIALQLNIPVIDESSPRHYQVDLAQV